MSTLAEFMILSSGDNRPPILEKHLYDSWKSKMELYMQNREHRRMILESVEHGPLIWPTIEENGVTRTKKYEELSATKKIQANCDLKATNIILQGLPSDVYSLINHHRVAKDLWERVQLLMQVNTKFLNSLPLEWSKFVTDVKLVMDLHTTNFDQLHAYLEQHELHANEVCILCERNQDLIALVANHQMTPSHFNTYQSSYNNPQFQQQFSPSQSPQYGLIHPIPHYSTTYLSIPRAVTYPSIPHAKAYSSIVQPDAYVLSEVPHYENTHNDMLNQSVQEMQYSEQTHLVNYPENEITSDSNIIPYSQYLLETQNAAVQDTNSSAQKDAMILSVFEQLSNQVTNCKQCQQDNLIANESLSAELERYKERVKLLEERQNVDLSTREKLIMDDIIQEKNAQFADFEKEINYLKQTLSEQSKEKELLTKTFNV
ncbi:hypothetical protein Tco_0971018 [Tanacetum coccineum]